MDLHLRAAVTAALQPVADSVAIAGLAMASPGGRARRSCDARDSIECLAEPALRTNAEEVGDDRHSDHQIRTDRRLPQVANQVPMPR